MDRATARQTERDNLRALIEANEAIHGKITAAAIQSAREEIYGAPIMALVCRGARKRLNVLRTGASRRDWLPF